MNRRADREAKIDRQPDNDLDWLAWCFVTGELADDQALDFQHRLESEPEVVRAVERAVELFGLSESGLGQPEPVAFGPEAVGLPEAVFAESGSAGGRVRLADKIETPNEATKSWRMMVVLSIAAIALVLVSVGIRWKAESAQRAHDDEMLATAWVGELDSEEPWDLASMLDDDFDGLMPDDSGPVDQSEVDDQGWIFAAAIALDGMDFDADGDEQQIN